MKVLAALPFLYAASRGLFSARGLNVELVEFANSNDVATAAVSGKIDFVGAGATNACLDAATASGQLLQISTSNDYVRRPNLQSTDFLISKKHFKSPVDLKGQTVAFFPGSFGKVFARLVLPKIGLSINDVKYVEMAPAQWLAALESNAVQAVTAMEPVATSIMEKLEVSVLVDGYYGLAMQNVPASGTWFRHGHLVKSIEHALQDSVLEAITAVTSDREKTTASIVEIFGLDRAISQKVRLLNWADTTTESGKDNVIKFARMLSENDAIQKITPLGNKWIWTR